MKPRAPIVRAGPSGRIGKRIGKRTALAAVVTLALGWYGPAFAEPAAPSDSPPASLKDKALLLKDKASTLAGDASAEAGRLLRQVMGSIAPVSMLAGARQRSGPSTMQEVSEGLTCQCGCGLTVANCNHPTCPFAVPLRTQIDGMIKAGMRPRRLSRASAENTARRFFPRRPPKASIFWLGRCRSSQCSQARF